MPLIKEPTQLEVVSISIVVIAQGHNPTILHPSFLRSQQVVPDAWELAEDPICTPPLSLVRFENGLVFTVEQQKLQLTDNHPPADVCSSEAPQVVLKYIRILPHVRYTAVGLNIHGFIGCKDPEPLIIESFLKSGTWNAESLKPTGLGLRLIYPAAHSAVLRLSVESGKIRRPSDSPEREGIILNANYHKDLSAKDPVADAEKAISLYQQYYEHFRETVKTIFESES